MLKTSNRTFRRSWRYFWDMPKELEPEDFYKTPEGFIVFTEAYHLKRGHCCQSGCKHCPYGFDKRTGRFTKNQHKP